MKREARGVWAVVPVKRAGRAKSRLATVLSPRQRVALQHAMLHDVLAALGKAGCLDGIAVISADAKAGEIVRRHGAIFLPEPPECAGLNQAIEAGVDTLRGAAIIAVIPADLPLLRGEEIDHAVERVRRDQVLAVVPDRHGHGTNALFFPAALTPAFQFGPESCRQHLAQSCPAIALPLASMELDLDMPADLARFMDVAEVARIAPRTYAVLAGALGRGNRLVCEDV